MGKIQQEIQLVDKVSPNLDKIQKNALALAKEYERLQKEQDAVYKQMEMLEKAGQVDSKTFKDLNSVYLELDEQMKKVARGGYEIKDSQDNLQQSTQGLQQSTQGLAISMTELNQTLEVAKKAWNMVKQATQEAYKWMEQYNVQFNAEFIAGQNLHTLYGYSGEQIKGFYNYAKELQSKGVVGDEAIIAGMGELSKHTRGATEQQLKDLTKLTLDLAVQENGLNTSMSNVSSTASMLGRALQGQTRTLKMNYGLTEAEVKSFTELDNVTDKYNKLLEVMSKHVNNTNEELANLAQGGLMQTRNKMSDLYELLGEKVTPYIAAFEEAVYQLLKPAIEWIADNMEWIAPTFIAVAAAIGIVIAAITALSIANFIAGASWLASLWPILLVIAAIGALIFLMAAIINYIRSIRGEANSALSAILGYVAMFVSNFYNILIVPLHNAIAGLVNFFANVWNHPLESVLISFINFGNGVLNVLNSIAQTIDTIFGTNLSSSISGWIDNLNRTKNEIKANSGYNEVMGMWENLNTQEMYNKGVKLGENIETGFNNAFKNNDWLSKLGEAIIPADDGSMALNTTSGDKNKLLGDEDIQLLLSLATRDFKIEYQQLTPEIMIDIGDVYQNADIDVIKETLVEDLAEVFDYDLGGVPA